MNITKGGGRDAICKPRNPVARALVTRKPGAHGKSKRALRKSAKEALRKALVVSGEV